MSNTEVKERRESLTLRAYREVFGQEGKRSKAQEMVLKDLESRGGIWRNAWIPNKDMNTDPYRAAIAEGQRIFAIATIQMANTKPGEVPRKPTVKTEKENTDA